MTGVQTCALPISALEVRVPEERFTIESAPIPDFNGAARGVVAEGPVGTRAAGRLRIFRYEIRCWRDGVIPDLSESVESPRRLSDDPTVARRVLELVPSVPTPVWGRDELGAGEMWNSNSLTSWLIARAGINTGRIVPPKGGRAPGWKAGLVVARLQQATPAPDRVDADRVDLVNLSRRFGESVGSSGPLRLPDD